MIRIGTDIRIPVSEFQFRFVRSSGPGGQNVNKVNSKAVLKWDVLGSPSLPRAAKERFLMRFANKITVDGHIQLTSDRHRHRKQNQADCLERLTRMLSEIARPPKKRKKTKPSKAAKRKRLSDKRRQSEKKQNRRSGRFD